MDYQPPVGGGANDPYVDGNAATGTEGSIPPAAAIEHPMREIVNAISALGGVPDSEDLTQLGAAIAAAIAAGQSPGVPTGTTINGYFAAAPTGFVEASGVTLSRATYSDLYDHAVAAGLVITEAAWQAGEYGMFSDGDGATTFRLPDLRGEFLRGWDHGRGVDSGRALGSLQDDAFQGHYHNLNAGVTGVGAVSGGNAGDPVGGDVYVRQPVTDGTNGEPRTAAETRPRNVAQMVCIKY